MSGSSMYKVELGDDFISPKHRTPTSHFATAKYKPICSGVGTKLTLVESEVTCGNCKKILKRMNRNKNK